MPETLVWAMIVLTVVLSTAADTLSTYYWELHSNSLLLAALVLSPCAYLCFGYVGARFGLSVASSLTNSLIVLGPISYGLLFRDEWRKVTAPQYVGMCCIVVGISLVAIFRQRS